MKAMDSAVRKRNLVALSRAVLRRVRRWVSPSGPVSTRQGRPAQDLELQSILNEIAKMPIDHRAHFKLAKHYFAIGRVVPAIAECRTSLAFGGQSHEIYLFLAEAYMAIGCKLLAADMMNCGVLSVDEFNNLKEKYHGVTNVLTKLSPDRYQRLKALAGRVEQVVSDPHVRILDVGGGDGSLCLFMPTARYVLAEPTVNGLGGQKTLFSEKSFDVVVACHVLEHIPDAQKENFLEELCSLAKTSVILLGPIYDNSYGATTPALIYRITRAPWALEHINCNLPTLEMLKEFATKNALECKITPNGDRAAVFWMVFAVHFARVAGEMNELEEIVEYSNRYLNDNISNPNQPNDYFVEFQLNNS